jgi:alanine-glyoxylate transaminase/serine-glyoxylate transaminase/serine-pyruvate transaminase
MREIVERCGATPVVVETEWGTPIAPEMVEAALKDHPAKIVSIVHAETSTGVLQPIEEISQIAGEYGSLLVVDTVTSLGGCPVEIDQWGIDASYSVTQKCLGAPPGLSPVTFSDRAVEAMEKRHKKVQSWYLDMRLIEKYWGEEHIYHHTPPALMLYALREALIVVQEEGLDARFARHLRNHRALVAGLEAMGLKMFVASTYRLPTLNTVLIPGGVDDLRVRRALLDRFQIEIGGGFGPLKGRIWRVGLMGYSSSVEHVALFLSALEQVLHGEGVQVPAGAGVRAATETL